MGKSYQFLKSNFPIYGSKGFAACLVTTAVLGEPTSSNYMTQLTKEAVAQGGGKHIVDVNPTNIPAILKVPDSKASIRKSWG